MPAGISSTYTAANIMNLFKWCGSPEQFIAVIHRANITLHITLNRTKATWVMAIIYSLLHNNSITGYIMLPVTFYRHTGSRSHSQYITINTQSNETVCSLIKSIIRWQFAPRQIRPSHAQEPFAYLMNIV